MQEFIVDLRNAQTFGDFVTAFNAGFCNQVEGKWSGHSWDAFHDYLSWPQEENWRLKLLGWQDTSCLSESDRMMIEQIFRDNPHVQIIYA